MEKFGLFRLLTALSGMAGPGDEPRGDDEPKGGVEAERPPADTGGAPAGAGGVFTEEERRRHAEQILARHEAISRRIDRRGKT